jgi:hypothetical protein
VSKSFPFWSDLFLNVLENGRGQPLPCPLSQGDLTNPYSARSFSDDPLYVGGVGRDSFSDYPKGLVASSSRISTHLDRNRFQTNNSVCALEKRIWTLFENSLTEWTLNLTSPHYIFLESVYFKRPV